MNQSKTQRLLEIVQEAASKHHVFESRGQGAGNHVTNDAIREINQKVKAEFGDRVVEVTLSNLSKQSVDFYFEDEGTVVEIEFSLSNPYPCLEKDAFKVLIAKENGRPITRLIFIGDPGCRKRLSSAAPQSIIKWLKKNHEIDVEVIELTAASSFPKADGQKV